VVVFAGPVFTEWYWGPIFFVLLYGPAIAAAALGADFAVRRWVRPLTWPRRGALWVGVMAAATLLVLVGRGLTRDVRFDRAATTAAQSFDFAPYEPDPLPRPFAEQLVDADTGWGGPAFISRYAAGPGWAMALQHRPGPEVSLQDGRCSVHDLKGTGTTFFEGPCRAQRTANGIDVFIGPSRRVINGRDAFAVLGGTLVRVEFAQVADRDVLAYYDALRPVAKEDIAFKRG
jgi:hypothetical protein